MLIMIPQLLSNIGLAWLAWYLYKFIIKPRLSPEEPRELPYLIPLIGHVIPMFTASHKLFTKGRNLFGGKPYSLTIMGETMYVISSAEDILAVYRSPNALDYDPFVKDILQKYGLTKTTVNKLFDVHGKETKSWVDTSVDNFNTQMRPGEKFEEVKDRLLADINASLTWDKLHGRMVLEESNGAKIVSLYDWCEIVIVGAQTRTFFGQAIIDSCPDLVSLFQVYENESWKFPLGLPAFATRTMDAAMDKMKQGLIKYLGLPRQARESASWVAQNLCDRLNELEIEPEQRALAFFSFYRVINANAFKLTFWVLAYVLFDNDLLKALKSEIQPVFEKDGTLQADLLFQSCPLLSSTCEEVMRLTNWPIGTRTVTAETYIGGKKLRPGRKLMMPYRSMHSDTNVFGADAAQFNPRRFMDNKALLKSTSYRPFGGAAHYCPGRFIARMEVQMFVAVMLNRFKIRLVDSSGKKASFPKMDDSLPSGGIQAPAKGHDLIIRVTPA